MYEQLHSESFYTRRNRNYGGTTYMAILTVENLGHSFGDRTLLKMFLSV